MGYGENKWTENSFRNCRRWTLTHNRRLRTSFSILSHEIIFFLSYFLAYLFRFDFEPNEKFCLEFAQSVFFVLAVKTFFFYHHRHFRNDMFFASVNSLRKVCASSFYSLVLLLPLKHLLFLSAVKDAVPISIVSSSSGVLMIDFGITIFLLGGTKFIARYVYEDLIGRHADIESKPAYMIGSNTESARIANIINARKTTGFHVTGFIALDEYKLKTEIDYIPIIGTIDHFIGKAISDGVRDILIVAGFLPGTEFRSVFDICRSNNLRLHVIPVNEISTSETIPIRSIDINDLLKRNPVYLDTEQIERNVRGKRILVTGAGGSIGSEICRQLLRFQPEELFILGRGENRIFFLDRELGALAGGTKITPIIADVTNADRIDEVFRQTKPSFVLHAAAHKHVSLMEKNVTETVLNNIYGTKVVADASRRHGVERFVLISTDKAVNPTSVMGTSKHLAERYVSAISDDSQTKFIITRFGNVLGSTGSVVPIFKSQIEKGGPITVTDYRMTRFFMTIPEASQLVLEASVMGKGGEIFVLDMGKPIHILELAKDLIRLSGLPDESIEIQEIGLRPGEKLYEELYFDSEQKINTPHPKLYAARHREFDRETVERQIEELLDSAQKGDSDEIRRKFKQFVPEYRSGKS